MALLWRGERVRESVLAWCGRHASMLGIPFAALGALGWALPEDLHVFAMILGVEAAVFTVPVVLLAGLTTAYFGATKRWGPVEVELDDRGLRIGDETIPTADLATAWALTSDELEVITHGGDELRLVFQNPEEAAAFGARIRAAADRGRSWSITSGSGATRLMRKAGGTYVPVTFASLFAAASPWLLPALPVGAGVAWLIGKGTRRVRFGADGFTIEGRFRKRYVPYREVVSVDASPHGLAPRVEVTLEDGSKLDVLGRLGPTRARLIRALIEEGAGMVERGEEAGAVMHELGYASGNEDELLKRLMGHGKTARYRDAAVEPERLERLIRNPAAAPAHRIAAAIALRESPGGRDKIRVAADVTDEPEVRVALEALAEDDLDERRGRELVRRMAR
ncbi:MAG: hypothetical protein KC619_03595 [Myxococcales bacterium]|nr:hypothetical protein [Myxococcales bacterium]